MTGYITGPKAIREFLDKPGINAAGICSQAGITQQYLLRQLKKGKLPSDGKLERLILVMKEYGFDRPRIIKTFEELLKDNGGPCTDLYWKERAGLD